MKRLLSTTLAVSILTTMNLAPALAMPVFNNGTNVNVTNTDANNMNVQIQGGAGSVGTANWDSFNVSAGNTVNFEFTAHNQTSINKVSATGGMSQIYGNITDSCGAGCGYNATGKIFLINPNGVLFGDTANVNVNSFTVSTLDINSHDDRYTNVEFKNNGSAGEITINAGAKIHGAKTVNMISGTNITAYKGSLISTDTGINGKTQLEDGSSVDAAYGKVKLTTADGVNFTYYNNGAVKEIPVNDQGEAKITPSENQMNITLNGEINAGDIDIRNASISGEIDVDEATLKATKAVEGNDGNIYLTSENKVLIGNTTITTSNSTGAEERDGGNVKIYALNKATVNSSTINAVGNIDITSGDNEVVVNNSNVNTDKDLTITAKETATLQYSTNVNANNIDINGKNVVINDNTNLTATNRINAVATEEMALKSAKFEANKIKLYGNNISGNADLTGNKAFIDAKININLKLKNVGNRENGLKAEAGSDMTLETDGDLSVSKLISGRNMKLTANRIISGYDKTTNNLRTEGDSTDRAYIEVGGTFESTPNYELTDSADLTADGQYNQRHHIQYGDDGSEKILLVTKLPYTAPDTPVDPGTTVDPVDPTPDPVDPTPDPVDPTPDPVDPTPDRPDIGPGGTIDDIPPINPGTERPTININDDQASMLNRLPQKPQYITNANNITDGRTMLLDVFAAASQIEIDEDE